MNFHTLGAVNGRQWDRLLALRRSVLVNWFILKADVVNRTQDEPQI